MKILYIKNNSYRAKEFQLKTIIYQKNGQKYVKKQALCKEAIPHLKKMKNSYAKLTASIINPKIKLAKIIDESEDSLTFEFIDGVSLETKFNNALKSGDKASTEIINEYADLLKTGFKTTDFDSSSMLTDEHRILFGDLDYSEFDGETCFEGISNIDLLFSNIIYRGNDIYLIDYEWVFDINISIDYAAFRTLHNHSNLYSSNDTVAFRALHNHRNIYEKMENYFIYEVVVNKSGFLKIQNNYLNDRLNVVIMRQEVHNKEVHIQDQTKVHSSEMHDKEVHIQDQNSTIENQNSTIENQNSTIENQNSTIENQNIHIQDQSSQIKQLYGDIDHWHNVAQSMSIKNRIKNTTRNIVPAALWRVLKKLKHTIKPVENSLPLVSQADIVEEIPADIPIINTYVYLEPKLDKEIQKELNSFTQKPLISIIMPVYNVAPKWLDLAIKSIEDQWYDNWELCIADDKSTAQETLDYLKNLKNPKIKVKFLDENKNISGASNEALSLTTGKYITLMDNDDEITPDALYEVVKVINEQEAEFIYSDEDKLEMDGTFSDPNFKPDFAADMFLSQNYLSHLGVIKKELITKVGGFTVGLEGSQDYDLYLKVLEHTDRIYHIEKVLYHWRKVPGSTAAEYGEKSYAQEAGRKALENAMHRREIKASVKNGQTPGTYKVDYEIIGTPLVSIIIPFKDKPELLKTCIESILEKSTYKNFEIIGISNNSSEDEIYKEMDRLKSLDQRISFHEYNVAFNYSEINNYAVEQYANGDHILFLNNDIEIITPSWIEEMLMYSQQEQNGAIGAKLYFPNDTIQHAGIVLVPKTSHSAILMYQGFHKEHYGYGSRLRCVNNYSAVTAACLMLKRKLFDKVGGFDEKRLSIAYNDVDLCLTLQEAGYKNIWTPYCEAYHHESISRGHEKSVQDVERREKEKWYLKDKHQDIFSHTDPFYNKKLTRFGVGSELDDSVTIHHESVNGIPFYEEVITSENFRDKVHNNICIFSHFDAEDEIKEYVIYYVKELSKFMDVIFVSTAEGLSRESYVVLEEYCRDIITKKNIGYDFSAWKTGIDRLGPELNDYEQLILCNDSVYGPLVDLENIFDEMQKNDLWAMTDNYEIEYHLQSYFMVYNKRAFTHAIFKDFWDHLKIYHNKQMLIENNEIGFSKALMRTDLSYGAYYSCKNKNYVNVLHYYWKELLTDHKFPFIKKELLQKNPLALDIENWPSVISSIGKYDNTLIMNQLK